MYCGKQKFYNKGIYSGHGSKLFWVQQLPFLIDFFSNLPYKINNFDRIFLQEVDVCGSVFFGIAMYQDQSWIVTNISAAAAAGANSFWSLWTHCASFATSEFLSKVVRKLCQLKNLNLLEKRSKKNN